MQVIPNFSEFVCELELNIGERAKWLILYKSPISGKTMIGPSWNEDESSAIAYINNLFQVDINILAICRATGPLRRS